MPAIRVKTGVFRRDCRLASIALCSSGLVKRRVSGAPTLDETELRRRLLLSELEETPLLELGGLLCFSSSDEVEGLVSPVKFQ